jgi:hypothetical protein
MGMLPITITLVTMREGINQWLLYVPSDDEGGDQPVGSTGIGLTATRGY